MQAPIAPEQVHVTDIHVDDGYTARLYDGDGTAGLRNVLATARGLAADVVLLAGDVFEHNRLPPDILQRRRSDGELILANVASG